MNTTFGSPSAPCVTSSVCPQDVFRRIDKHISALAADPRPAGSAKLRERGYRIRVGNRRVVYIVDDVHEAVVVTDVRRRNEATYRGG